MFKVKKILNLIALVIGGLVGVSLLTGFSFAQNFWQINGNLFDRTLRFPMSNNHIYLYAITEPNVYTVYFDGNGSASGSMNNMVIFYDQNVKLLPNNFIKDGYTFKGWSTSKTGDVEYLDQAEIKNLTAENSGEITLYAQREGKVPYIVEYYQENVGGTGYDLVETGIVYGDVGTGILLTGKMYTGFTLQTGVEIVISSGGVVPYYYTRNTYNLTVFDRDQILVDTGVKFGTPIPIPADPEWIGNIFDGWDNLPDDGKMPANDLVITSRWSYGMHTITFDTDGGTEIEPMIVRYGDPITPPENPTKSGFEFVGWDPALPTVMSGDDIIVKAVWKEVSEDKGGGRSGGGGRDDGGGGSNVDTSDTDFGDTDSPEGEKQHEAATDGNHPRRGMEDLEVFFAYMWAHDMGIIESSREDSDPDGYVTRGDMAEMVVKFTDKVLGRGIPSIIPVKCKWGDAESEWKSPETKVYAQKACALGVMGIRMQDFMPNKILDRAEFGTILSRLLWGDKYDVVDATKTKLYYTRHLEALSDRKIMTQIDNPEEKKELRKWAWLMLMRSRIQERWD